MSRSRRDVSPATRLTKSEAHPFRAAARDPDRCALCGESRVQIRHNRTRIIAACRLKGLDPNEVLEPR